MEKMQRTDAVPPAVRVTLGGTTHLLSTQQLQRYPSSLLPSLAADSPVQRNGEICLTLSPTDWNGRFHEEEAAFVLELYKSGCLAQACKVLKPFKDEDDFAAFQQLTAAVDYFQLPTEEVLSFAALIDTGTGPSDLSSRLLRLLSVAAAKKAAKQVLQLHFTHRQALCLETSARFLLAAAVTTGQKEQATLRAFAYAPFAADSQLHKDKKAGHDLSVASLEWIGVDGSPMYLMQDLRDGMAARNQGYVSVGDLARACHLVACFINVESVFRATSVRDVKVRYSSHGSCADMWAVELKW